MISKSKCSSGFIKQNKFVKQITPKKLHLYANAIFIINQKHDLVGGLFDGFVFGRGVCVLFGAKMFKRLMTEKGI